MASGASADASAEVEGGELVFAGCASWSMAGRSGKSAKYDGAPEDQNLYNFHRLAPLVGIKVTRVFTGPVACHTVAIAADGTAYVWGRNEDGQLGLGDTTNRYNPTRLGLPDGERVKGGACGSKHTLLYTKTGSLFSFGACGSGQLGIGRTTPSVNSPTRVNLESVRAAGCGRDFSMVADANGHVFAFGSPEYGQLGNGTDGKMLERAGKYTFANETRPYLVDALLKIEGASITDLACGANHTAAMDGEGRIYTWGFAGYGRLGHGDNKDQMLPPVKAVEIFSKVPPPPDPSLPKFMQRTIPKVRAVELCCGSTATYAVAGAPYYSLYMWGITKRSGEATMAPAMVDDLQGWKVRSVSCGNTSTIVAAEESLITWGPSPTYGELGYGSGEGVSKSSTRAKEVDDLKGSMVLSVAMGYGHAVAIVDSSDAKSRKLLDALSVFEPDEVSAAAAGESQDSGGGKKRKGNGGGGKGKKKKKAS